LERKLATVVFVDLVDSTGLVVNADPEIVRRRVNEYFDRASRCIERHGGTVEKFAGDAVMAAFGVPSTHEDDADRAVRAAFAVLEEVHDLALEARVGVEAGEVVVDDGESTFVTGEAVNIAARLQQAAAPGEIVLGPTVRRLTAGTVEVEEVGPVELKGRPDPLWTWRAVRPVDAPPPVAAAWFVGRDEELELLENVLARARRDRRAHLVTVFGEPGIGKSRLVREFTEGAERVTVLRGRALPYGEGVSYWPLASMIKDSAGITDDAEASEAFERLRLSCESEAVADLLAVALGVLGAAEEGHSAGELTWAVTTWAERLAEAQPLVLVFEDVHWGDDALLDLIEHLARTLRNSPALLVCVARPDLLDSRPAWGGGNPRALAIELGPLGSEESGELVDALLARADVPPGQRALALEKAEGNPLFLEETARMLVDDEGVVLKRIPDSIQALIAARIDTLDPDDKRLLQRAALVGRVFWRGALDALSPDVDVAAGLDRLLEREFAAPEAQSSITGERAFRFTHGLIREVAHATVSKAERAQDHRRVARWVAERAPELADISAHHLERAAALTAELEGAVPPDLAREAAAALEGAGRRSIRRSSFAVARSRFRRAVELEATLARRYFAALAAWRLTDVPAARQEAALVLEDARKEDAPDLVGRVLVLLAEISLGADSDVARAAELADEALAVLPADELVGLHDARSVHSAIAWWLGDGDASRRHAEATVDIARAMNRRDLESLALSKLVRLANVDDEPEQAKGLAQRALELAEESGSREAFAFARSAAAGCAEESDNLEAAESAYREALAAFEEIGAAGRVGWVQSMLATVELRRGNVGPAENLLRDAVSRLRAAQDAGFLVEAERQLAETLVKAGKLEEAERVAEHARSSVGREDVWSRASTLHALGIVRAAQGRTAEAEALLRESLAIVEPTMYRNLSDQVRASLDELGSTSTAEHSAV
jgi:class 3 adenylate cyclase/tetratricopeptide (TPR) repeat protein/Arc/MetJ family transcription regulator